eukprot:TRINITY_DN3774_c0_g3_i1.p1 TRINITY_DN3774_c0_g3~~TRINITY_DN3774_c0_g3_i1.p1  ORF type:complete len:285 (-),score=62.76 TRINITY_DN3774_c0_g3_i1:136-990(-)
MATRICAVCDNVIEGRQIQAEGTWFHPDCFACDLCHLQLVLGTYSEIEGKRVCQNCRNQDRCSDCGLMITGKSAMEVDGKLWHKECFVCYECGEPLKKFVERDDHLYCPPCLTRKFDGVCYACSGELGRKFTKACGQSWHDECFKCKNCKRLFGDDPFVNINGEPWCDDCEANYDKIQKSKTEDNAKAALAKAAALAPVPASAKAAPAGGRGAPLSGGGAAKAAPAAAKAAPAPKAAPKVSTKAAEPPKAAPVKAVANTGYQKSTKKEDEDWNDMDDFAFGDRI